MRAFHLGTDHVGVHGHPAVDGAHDPLDPGQAVLAQRDLGHLGDEAAEGLLERDAAGPARGKGSAPARLRRRQLEHGAVSRMVFQELAAQLEGIALGGLGQLVEEGLGGEGGVGVTDGAPPEGGHARPRASAARTPRLGIA